MATDFVGLFTFANQPQCTVTTGGTAALAQGASEQWTVSSSATFPAASTTTVPALCFPVADTAATTEIVWVTAVTSNVWGVMRGAENTTPVTHASNFIVQEVVSAGVLNNFKQASNAAIIPITVASTTVQTTICTYAPTVADLAPGTTFELVATGSIRTATAGPTLRWNVMWGAGTVLSMITGTNCPALTASIPSGSSIDVNGSITFTTVGSSTAAVANINTWWQSTTVTSTGVASSGAATALTGAGPLALTAQWGTSNATNATIIPAPFIYRAC